MKEIICLCEQVRKVPCHWGAVLGCDGGGGGVHQGVQTELNSWWSWWCCWWCCWLMVMVMLMVCRQHHLTAGKLWTRWWCDATVGISFPSQHLPLKLLAHLSTFHRFCLFIEESCTWEHEREVKVHWSLQDACQGYLVGSDKYLVQVHCTQAQVQVWYLAAINNMINIHSSISSTFVLKMPSLISLSTLYLTWISQRQEWYREDKGRAELDTTSRVQIWKEKDKICRDC